MCGAGIWGERNSAIGLSFGPVIFVLGLKDGFQPDGGLCLAGWLVPEADIPRGPALARTRPSGPYDECPLLGHAVPERIVANPPSADSQLRPYKPRAGPTYRCRSNPRSIPPPRESAES
jgi:hypothetical protein